MSYPPHFKIKVDDAPFRTRSTSANFDNNVKFVGALGKIGRIGGTIRDADKLDDELISGKDCGVERANEIADVVAARAEPKLDETGTVRVDATSVDGRCLGRGDKLVEDVDTIGNARIDAGTRGGAGVGAGDEEETESTPLGGGTESVLHKEETLAETPALIFF